MNGHDWMDCYEDEELEEMAYYDNDPYAYMRSFEWRQIKGHLMYEVSREGYVRSWKSGSPRILATWPNQYGHRYARIEGETYLIHRLVAEYFIPNLVGAPVVRHMDDNLMNNRVDNLVWGTQADNRRDCVERGRDFVKSVYCYETDRIYRSCAEAAEDLGVTRGAITMCCQGKTHECQGYHLCYLKDKIYRLEHLNEWLNHSPYKPVKATNLETGEVIIFPSRKAAAEELGIPDCGISSTVTGRTPHSHGWRFENYEQTD